jgi:hypothetical protein
MPDIARPIWHGSGFARIGGGIVMPVSFEPSARDQHEPNGERHSHIAMPRSFGE